MKRRTYHQLHEIQDVHVFLYQRVRDSSVYPHDLAPRDSKLPYVTYSHNHDAGCVYDDSLVPPCVVGKDRRCAGSRVGPTKGERSMAEEVSERIEGREGLAAAAVLPGDAESELKDPFRLFLRRGKW